MRVIGPVRLLVVTVLEQAGYKVVQAADGEEAARLFEKRFGGIDLVLLDVIMPKMSGFEAYEAVCRSVAAGQAGSPADYPR